MIFALTVMGGYSLCGLILLFTLSLVSLGLVLHFVYKSVNDEKTEQVSDLVYEEVSMKTLTQLAVYKHKAELYLAYNLVEIFSLQDAAKTLLFFVIVHVIALWLWIFSPTDKNVAWVIYNIVILTPFMWLRIQPFM